VRFFAQVASDAPCAQPPMVTRTQICRRDLRGGSWTPVQARLNPAQDASGCLEIWLQRCVLRLLPRTHGRSRRWSPPQWCAFHQRTAAFRHLRRGDPDDLFDKISVLERGSGGTPGLGCWSATGMPADAARPRRASTLARVFRETLTV
jgi:hypothetical protein